MKKPPDFCFHRNGSHPVALSRTSWTAFFLQSVFTGERPASGLPALACRLLSIFRSWHSLGGFMWSLFKEFLRFCRQEKKWWLIPLIVLLLVLGAILLFTASSGIAWALYPFM
jgi:hypothetical protein